MIRNVPRIRDVESMLGAARAASASRSTGPATTRSACRPTRSPAPRSTRSSPTGSAPRSWSPGPLLARFGEVQMPPPGGDTIGRRRLDAHLDAFRDIGAKIDGDVWIELSAPPDGPEAEADLHGRALGDGDRERAARRGAHRGPDDDRQRRLRAPRPGPGPAALQDGRPGRRDRLERDDGPRPRQARRRRARRLPRPHRDRQLHGARRRHQRRAPHPRRRRPRTSRGSGVTSAASACRR